MQHAGSSESVSPLKSSSRQLPQISFGRVVVVVDVVVVVVVLVVVVGATSGGHVAPLPVQLSAMSSGLAEGRQMLVAGWKASVGQAALVPVQLSARSQTPAEARHSVVGGI